VFMHLDEFDKFDFVKFKHFVEVESGSGDTLVSGWCSDKNEIIKFKCNKGRIFDATPYEYVNGLRCKMCLNGTHMHPYRIRDKDKKQFIESKGYKVIDLRCGKLICLEGHNCKIDYFVFKSSGRRCQECGNSSGETAIKEYLQRNRIFAVKQYTFDDCRDSNPLEFDFALIKSGRIIAIIEYDGECHYRAKGHYGNAEALLKHQRRDGIKTNYCEANKITLLRIPYWRIQHIDELLDEWLVGKI
jgi:hypothetical protein